MGDFEVTSLSSKGQVVIPSGIRKRMGIKAGTKLVVITDGSNLLLKPIETPKLDMFNSLIKASRKYAEETKLTQDDVAQAIEKVRHDRRA